MRREGLHMDWSHILKLTKLKTCIQMSLMNDSTPSVARWFEMEKIARKCFEVLSKGEGQAMVWWPRNLAKVKKEVLAFSQGTDQTILVILKWRIKSYMTFINGWLDNFEANSHLLNRIKSKWSRWLCSRIKSKSTCWHPLLMKIESYGISVQENSTQALQIPSSVKLEL